MRIPFLGKSGTSRISFFRWSQFTAIGFTMLLQFEMLSGLAPAVPGLPVLHPLARPVGPCATYSTAPPAAPVFPPPALPRCRPRCCAPIRPGQAAVLHGQQTSGNQRPERVRAHNKFSQSFFSLKTDFTADHRGWSRTQNCPIKICTTRERLGGFAILHFW